MFIIHANIVCTNFERSFDFYTRVMGGTVLEVTDDDGSDLSVPMGFIGTSGYRAALLYWSGQGRGPYLDLLEWKEKGVKIPRTAKDTGLARLCWCVENLDEKAAELESKGVVFNAPINTAVIGRFTTRAVFFPDPDGTLLEIVQTRLTDAAA